MTNAQLKKIKAGLIKILKAKKQYEKDVDDDLISQYLFNLDLIEEAKIDLANRGLMVQLGKDGNFYQQNFALSALVSLQKQNQSLLKSMGLEKAKIELDKDDKDAIDKLNKFLNG